MFSGECTLLRFPERPFGGFRDRSLKMDGEEILCIKKVINSVNNRPDIQNVSHTYNKLTS